MLSALCFRLYGVTDRDGVRYVYSTFPIVELQETKAYGRNLARDLCLAWMNALEAGRPDAEMRRRRCSITAPRSGGLKPMCPVDFAGRTGKKGGRRTKLGRDD